MKILQVDVSLLTPTHIEVLKSLIRSLSLRIGIDIPCDLEDFSLYTREFDELTWPSRPASNGDKYVG